MDIADSGVTFVVCHGCMQSITGNFKEEIKDQGSVTNVVDKVDNLLTNIDIVILSPTYSYTWHKTKTLKQTVTTFSRVCLRLQSHTTEV